jgi:hypothetical protein
VTGGWRRLHNEELHNTYSSPNIIRVIKSNGEMNGACSTQGRDEKCVQCFGCKTRMKAAAWKTWT